ncbi:MAG: hypothetical protein ACK2T6_01605 [Anaerolineae bacterium]
MPTRIDTPEYWIDEFRPTSQELELLYGHVLETMRPVEVDELAKLLVRRRVDEAVSAREARARADGTPYQPRDRYEKGQRLLFPALGGVEGVVQGVREGNNPAYGKYDVLEVNIGSDTREFAAGIEWDHQLTQVEAELDPDELTAAFAPVVAPQLATILDADKEWLLFGNRYVLRALLPKINKGHRNLAEAIVMLAGEPLPPEQILEELDLDSSIPVETRALALSLALAEDSRFRNVGAHESPLWTLKPTN